MRASASSYAPRWRGKAAERGARSGDVNDLAKLDSGALAALPFDQVAERSMRVTVSRPRRRTAEEWQVHLDEIDEHTRRRRAKREAKERGGAVQAASFPVIRASIDGPSVLRECADSPAASAIVVEKRHTPASRHVHRFWPSTDGNGKVIDRCRCGEVSR